MNNTEFSDTESIYPPQPVSTRRERKRTRMEEIGLYREAVKENIDYSLTELQNGRMELTTDGDLFKVVLSFPTIR